MSSVISVAQLKANVACRLNELTNRTFALPLLFFYPTSRCNSRCVSCDWWKSAGRDDLSLAEIEQLAASLPVLGTRAVVFSGGEPLVRVDVFAIASLMRQQGCGLWLLTSGVSLARHADAVARLFDRVTISLDAADAPLYERVRGIDALDAIASGVRRLKNIAPDLPVHARATLHRRNFRQLRQIVSKARSMRLDGVSFLAADVASNAFGRADNDHRRAELLLDEADLRDFVQEVEAAERDHREDFNSGFIAESPAKLRRLPQYYAAMNGLASFPPIRCRAPWLSVVVEADGSVRPCFFHRSIGNVRQKPLARIVREELPAFRRSLDPSRDPLCARCVCSLDVGLRSRFLV